MYIKKMYECGTTIEIEKIHTWKYKSKKYKREKSFKKSSEAQQKQKNKNLKTEIKVKGFVGFCCLMFRKNCKTMA